LFSHTTINMYSPTPSSATLSHSWLLCVWIFLPCSQTQCGEEGDLVKTFSSLFLMCSSFSHWISISPWQLKHTCIPITSFMAQTIWCCVWILKRMLIRTICSNQDNNNGYNIYTKLARWVKERLFLIPPFLLFPIQISTKMLSTSTITTLNLYPLILKACPLNLMNRERLITISDLRLVSYMKELCLHYIRKLEKFLELQLPWFRRGRWEVHHHHNATEIVVASVVFICDVKELLFKTLTFFCVTELRNLFASLSLWS